VGGEIIKRSSLESATFGYFAATGKVTRKNKHEN